MATDLRKHWAGHMQTSGGSLGTAKAGRRPGEAGTQDNGSVLQEELGARPPRALWATLRSFILQAAQGHPRVLTSRSWGPGPTGVTEKPLGLGVENGREEVQ